MTVEVNCRYRPKEQCSTAIATADGQNTNWCPKNLVLLYEDSGVDGYPFRVYMTEGPRTQQYPEFTDSYEVIFDTGYERSSDNPNPIPTSKVVLCSILTTMRPVVVTSLAVMFMPEYVEYLDPENKTILFHERWLDGTNWIHYGNDVPEQFANGNLTLPPRNMSEPTGNVYLAQFGKQLAVAWSPMVEESGNNAAMILETVVSATFLQVYSMSGYSDSQYPFSVAPLLPESLMPETPLYHPERNLTITLYNLGYGFRLSSRTGILGVTILITHAVMVVLGSLWQLFWRRSVITAWDTIPDYVALGLGSVIPPADVLDNTCAGIAAGKTLQNLARVGETTDQHLEITVGDQDPASSMKSVLGKLGAVYGSRGGGLKEKLE